MDELPFEEKKAFETDLAKNGNLQKSFEEFKLLFETVEEAGLRDKLEDFHKFDERKENNPVRKLDFRKPRFNYRMVASIAILLAVGSLWFFTRQSPNEKLYDTYFTPDPGLPTVMGNNDDYAFYEAMVDYKQGHYGIAIEKWEELLQTKPENDTLNYFLGVSHLVNGNSQEAINYLRPVGNDEDSIFFSDANTYLGLAFLKTDEISEAKKALEKGNNKMSSEILSEIE